MARRARPAKAEIRARKPVASKPPNKKGSSIRDLEKRLAEALEQQGATSEILRVISGSLTDVQPVFDIIAERSEKLCDAETSVVSTNDGALIQLAAIHGVSPEGIEAISRHYPMRVGAETVTARAINRRAVVHVPDVLADPAYESKDAARTAHYRACLGVPMLREGRVIGSIFVARPNPGFFTDTQIELLKTFADQAVIAIENVRLFKELETRNRDLTEALEQQTATSEILRVISQSPTDVQPVFDTIAAAALKLCRAGAANVYTFDGKLIRIASDPKGDDPIRSVFPRPPSRDTAITRAVLTGSVVAIPDVLEDPEYMIRDVAIAGGFRSSLAIPLLRDGSPIGAIALGRPEPGLFSDNQVALLQTFANQAVIAIENVRLFKELESRNRDLTEALEQQTATSEILRVISQSQTDAQPVFDTIAASALKLCSAISATVTTFDGKLLHVAAIAVVNPEGADAVRKLFPRPPSRDITASRAILTCGVVAIPDVLEDPDFAHKASALAGGFRSTLAVPLMRERSPIGAIVVGRPEPGPYPDQQIALLQTFADQAVIAIENARLFKELQARTTELTKSVGELRALGEVGQAVSSTLDLGTVLKTIVSRAVQLTGLDGGSIYEYDERAEEFRLQAAENMPQDVAEDIRKAPTRKGDGALGRTAITLEPTQVPDTLDGSYRSARKKLLIRAGYRALLAVPLLREDHLLGGLLVNRKTPGAFAPEIVELLKTFATQSALAIQNARLFREIEEKSRQLEVASQHKSDFLANMSHELRTPLNAIIGFSEVLLERLFGELNDKQADYLNDIHSSGRHLLSLINDILDLSKIEAGRMELEPSGFELSEALSNAMTLVRERAQQHGIVMVQQLDAELGEIVADERKFKQILVNLLSNAVKFTPDGGRIDVRVRREDGNAVIAVHDTGIGIAPEDQAAVFEEFRQVGRDYTNKQEGTGLGLALTKKFVELHGGRIWLESEPGKGSTFTFTIPMTR